MQSTKYKKVQICTDNVQKDISAVSHWYKL